MAFQTVSKQHDERRGVVHRQDGELQERFGTMPGTFCFFLKKWANPGLFCLFSFFSCYNFITN